jgi:mannose-6-phosphate isomerase
MRGHSLSLSQNILLMDFLHGVLPLNGVVQHYSWGGFDFIPMLLKLPNPDQKPFAEYWLGAHPNHPSRIKDQTLTDLINNNPHAMLGRAAKKFSSLPYLFKVLDVRQMLSIQVHPSKQSAEKGFDEENEKGIPVTASNRNYKDRNHKPELMVALSDFWLLHGFKNESALLAVFETTPELHFLKKIFAEGGYRKLYEEVMLMDQQKVNEVLHPLLQRIVPLYHNQSLKKQREDFWAARAAISFCKEDKYDRGIFSIYLFNLVHLKEGEGIYQPGGMPHAYLEGQNVEIMANSDNVLRAGLTDKYIDVAELLKHVRFEPTIPDILHPGSGHSVYHSPAEEFELHRYQLKDHHPETINASSAELLLITDGTAMLSSENGDKQEIKKGEAFFVTSGTQLYVEPGDYATIFRATVPAL